jgi:predicted enzyme related to lactoylglutathione lyase
LLVTRFPVARFDLVTIDAPDTDAAAQFWSETAGLHEVEREDVDRWIVLADAGGQRRLGIQRGPTRPGSMHLDLACDVGDFDGELARMVALGARLLAPPRHEPYGSIANLCDPDGNPFDLCAYH